MEDFLVGDGNTILVAFVFGVIAAVASGHHDVVPAKAPGPLAGASAERLDGDAVLARRSE